MDIRGLGYVTVASTDLSRWLDYGTQVLGMMADSSALADGLLGRDAEVFAGLDHLQRLVEHRRRIDGDPLPHRPVRMRQSLFHRGLRQRLQRVSPQQADRPCLAGPGNGIALMIGVEKKGIHNVSVSPLLSGLQGDRAVLL